jgi:hypothetical protein
VLRADGRGRRRQTSTIVRMSSSPLKSSAFRVQSGRLRDEATEAIIRSISEAQVRLHHWRITGGAEVDMVLEREDGLIVGIESKTRDPVTADDVQGLAALRDQVGDQFCQGIVLHTGKRGSIKFGERLSSLPSQHFGKLGVAGPQVCSPLT